MSSRGPHASSFWVINPNPKILTNMNVTRQELSYENPQLIGPNPVLLNLDFESPWRTSATTLPVYLHNTITMS